ncbi:unnamed protein product [Pleuronectes platessa]|uniref:Uncharacterized protein n=1 Tax=Pleuronectes platessa TaxID=8262 RepID=A0A9N7VFW6_PLEPL|nr:unnamed protein product [Pleuronectes platessa]
MDPEGEELWWSSAGWTGREREREWWIEEEEELWPENGPSLGGRWFGSVVVERASSDPLSLILSPHDKEKPSPGGDVVCVVPVIHREPEEQKKKKRHREAIALGYVKVAPVWFCLSQTQTNA